MCVVEGCPREVGRHGARGRCSPHYMQLRRLEHKADPKRFCDVEGCDRPTKDPCSPFCEMHYARVRRLGAPGEASGLIRARGTGGLTGDGYIVRQLHGRRMPEHRRIFEEAVGRPLRDFENVHHKNGVRADNRIENLELWVESQPSGQRAADLAAWVVATYPELIAAIVA